MFGGQLCFGRVAKCLKVKLCCFATLRRGPPRPHKLPLATFGCLQVLDVDG